MTTYYDVLGISKNSSTDDIKKAYRALSMELHPDRNRSDPTATSRFQEVATAYGVLSDANRRRSYDMSINQNDSIHGPLHPDDIYNMFAQTLFSGIHPTIFTQQGGQWTQDVMSNLNKPQAIEVTIEISLTKAYTGCTEAVGVKRWITEPGGIQREERETLYIPIPKGADDGEIVIVNGKGHVSPEGRIGDVKVFLKVDNGTDFSRKGLDLVYNKCISLREALCGFSFDVQHVNGKVFTIHNHRGNVITPGYRKVVPKLGMERDGHNGNFIVEFQIVFPNKISLGVADQLDGLL